MFGPSHSDLDEKIKEFEKKVTYITPTIFGSWPEKRDWDDIFSLAQKINEQFKGIRYPTKQEREIAWQRFYSAREQAYKERTRLADAESETHFDNLMYKLKSAEYSALADFLSGLLTFDLIKTTAEDMKGAGRILSEARREFSSVKHRMTKEHKTRVFERIIDIQKSHDAFWGKYKSYKEAQSKIYEEKKAAWAERQERISSAKERRKNNIEQNKEKLEKAKGALEKQRSNISKNENSLEKAKNALEKMKSSRDDLKDKIYDSYNDNWKEKAEGWLEELEDKISDVENSIERLENWIEEGEEKIKDIENYMDRLRSWIDEDESKL